MIVSSIALGSECMKQTKYTQNYNMHTCTNLVDKILEANTNLC